MYRPKGVPTSHLRSTFLCTQESRRECLATAFCGLSRLRHSQRFERWLINRQYRAPSPFFSQRDSGNFVGADRRCWQHERKTPPFRIYEIGCDPIKHYLQALLTKSEIELKLSQCKIQ